MDKDVVIALLTLLGLLITGYISWRLGRLQISQQREEAETTYENAFSDNLLELLGQQEQKLQRQEARIDTLLEIADKQRTLSDEFRRANLLLSLDKQRLERRLEELEREAEQLRKELEKLKKDVHT